MSRLFTFGCSFTNYAWPTWADFLGLEFEYFENWGVPGIGNIAIANRVAECFVKNNITEDDVVIIQWTSHIRHDYHLFSEETGKYAANSWKTKGSIFSHINANLYDKKWQDKFFDEQSYVMLSLNAIYATMQLVKSKNCKWKMTSMGAFDKLGSDYTINPINYGENKSTYSKNLWEDDLFLPYKSIWDDKNWLEPLGCYAWKNVEELYKWDVGKNQKPWTDPHPSPNLGIDWLYNIVKPSLNLTNDKLTTQQIEWLKICRDLRLDNLHLEEFATILEYKLNDYDKSYRGY